MTTTQQVLGVSWLALAPFIALAAAAVAILLAATVTKRHLVFAGLSVAGALAALVLVIVLHGSADRRATGLLNVDDFSLYYIGLLSVLAIVLAVLSWNYLSKTERRRADYYSLMVTAALGSAVLAASSHFASLFLGLEILSVALYGLIAYPSERTVSIEAGLKYLVLAGATSAFLLLGIAFVYAMTGTLSLSDLPTAAQGLAGGGRIIYLAGLILVLTGIGFKLAVVPFHMWTPDVYQGAASPVTGFVASVSKAGVFVLLLRYSALLGLGGDAAVKIVLEVIAYASMLGGNLLALLQTNVKRMLAYSSIGHLGFLLVGLLAGGSYAGQAVAFYLSTYTLAIVAAFGVLGLATAGGVEPEHLDSLRGLGRKRPWLGAMFTVALLSLAGLPVSAGFIGKFLLVQAGAQTGRWGLVIVLVIASAIGLFYYLRVILTVFSRRPAGTAVELERGRGFVAAGGTLGIITVVLLVLGVYPSLLLRLLGGAASVFR